MVLFGRRSCDGPQFSRFIEGILKSPISQPDAISLSRPRAAVKDRAGQTQAHLTRADDPNLYP